MIRLSQPNDIAAILSIAEAIGFQPGELGVVHQLSAECDRALYLSNSFSQAYQRCLQEGFSQGAEGYARDLVNAVSAWSFALEDITVPVDLWYGGLDTSPVHSPDFGVTLAARLPQATHILDPNEGSSILWTRSHAILLRLKSHVSQ
jgi:pimeloyl-ACP methyl ester carboxylesterase